MAQATTTEELTNIDDSPSVSLFDRLRTINSRNVALATAAGVLTVGGIGIAAVEVGMRETSSSHSDQQPGQNLQPTSCMEQGIDSDKLLSIEAARVQDWQRTGRLVCLQMDGDPAIVR